MVETDLDHVRPTALLSALEVRREVLIKQAHAIAGRALGHGGRVLLAPRHTRDIEMRPLRSVDETLQEHCADRGAAIARAADVLDVGDIAVDLLVVTVAQRHAPERLP